MRLPVEPGTDIHLGSVLTGETGEHPPRGVVRGCDRRNQVLRIGNGVYQKAGTNLTLTATEAGTVSLGIAINPRFGVNDGLRYPGEFKVDVRVIRK